MLKKSLLFTLLILSCIGVTACLGGDADPASTAESEVTYEKRTGIVRALGATIYREGTHRLEVDGRLAALLAPASPQIQLDQYLDAEVNLEGIVRPSIEPVAGLEMIQVVAVTPLTAADTKPVTYSIYSDSEFDYQVKVPSTLTIREGRRGVAFYTGETKVIEISVLDNKSQQDLAAWLSDNYGYTASNLVKVSVNGLSGYQFQNSTGTAIYFAQAGQVFALAWLDTDPDQQSRNKRYFLELVQSFALGDQTILPKTAVLGAACGLASGADCAQGLTCSVSTTIVGGAGVCTSSTPTTATAPSAATLPALTTEELSRGWYYGDRDSRRPGTPESWILVDTGTRFAMWRRPESAADESQITLEQVTAEPSQLSTDRQKVFNYLKANLDSLAPEKAASGSWELQQIAFADPSFVYATYSAAGQTRRLLLVYAIRGETISLQQQAYFLPGESRDWIASEGVDAAFGKALTVVSASGQISGEILEGYREFRSTRYGYSLQYPKDWYWQNASTTRVEFANRPFPAALPMITTEVVAGTDFAFDQVQIIDKQPTVFVQLSTTQSLRISAASENLSTGSGSQIIGIMAQSFKVK